MKVIPDIQHLKEKKLEADRILQETLAQGKRFTDEEFPPSKSSLIPNRNVAHNLNILENLVWKRPSELLSAQNIKIFPDYLFPDAIEPGISSSPYFLSALSILAERPKVLARIFARFKINEAGLYSVFLNIMGEWQYITIDDYFPFDTTGNKWAFTKGQKNEIWPLILEKAYAKVNHSYDSLDKGYVAETLMDLIGAPFEVLKLTENSDLFLKIKDAIAGKNLVYCSRLWPKDEKSPTNIFSPSSGKFNLTSPSKEDMIKFNSSQGVSLSAINLRESSSPPLTNRSLSPYKKDDSPVYYGDPSLLGISKGYEYSVLEVREISLAKGRVERLVKIRNPWESNIRWDGRWSPSSSVWTSDLIEELRYDPKNPKNVFWIAWEEFVKFYNIVCISKYEEDFQYKTIPLKQIESLNQFYTSVLRLTVHKTTKAFLSVNQIDEKLFKKNPSISYRYFGCRLLLGKFADQTTGLEFVSAKYNNSRNTILEANLEPGEYIVTIDMLWETEHIREFTLSCYSSETIELDTIDDSSTFRIQKNLIKSLSLQNLSFLEQTVRGYENLKDKNISMAYGGKNLGILFFYYRNFSNKQIRLQETVEIQMSGLERFEEEKVGNNYLGKLVFLDSQRFIIDISAGDEAVILFKTKRFCRPSYNPQFEFAVELLDQPQPPVFRLLTVYEGSEVKLKQQQSVRSNLEKGEDKNEKISSRNISLSSSRFGRSQEEGDFQVINTGNINQDEKKRTVKIIKSSKQPTKRLWDGKFVECYAYNYQAKQGYFILVENFTDMIYEEIIDIKDCENLEIKDHKAAENVKIIFKINPGEFDCVFFEVIDPRRNYSYNHRNMYRFISIK